MAFKYLNRPHFDLCSCRTRKTVIEPKSVAKEQNISNLRKRAEEGHKHGTDKEKAIRMKKDAKKTSVVWR